MSVEKPGLWNFPISCYLYSCWCNCFSRVSVCVVSFRGLSVRGSRLQRGQLSSLRQKYRGLVWRSSHHVWRPSQGCFAWRSSRTLWRPSQAHHWWLVRFGLGFGIWFLCQLSCVFNFNYFMPSFCTITHKSKAPSLFINVRIPCKINVTLTILAG